MIDKLSDIFNHFSLIQFILDVLVKFIKSNFQIFQIFFDFLISFGTFFAVYVALNQKQLSMKIGGPKLIASVSDYKIKKKYSDSNSQITYQYRYLNIKNSGFSTAEKVKCKISRIIGTNKPHTKEKLEFNFPRSLPWPIIGNQNSQNIEFERDIFPNEVQILNFVCLHKNSKAPQHVFFLMDDSINKTLQTLLYPPGNYCDEIFAEINLYCENAITNPQYFRLYRGEDGSFQIVEIEKNKWKEI